MSDDLARHQAHLINYTAIVLVLERKGLITEAELNAAQTEAAMYVAEAWKEENE